MARRKERTKKLLLEVALTLFYEKGIYWTKIEDITERADIGKGTFYKYFETKEEVLRALLEQGLNALLAEVSEGVKDAESGQALLKHSILRHLDFYIRHPQFLLFFHQVRGLLQLQTDYARQLRTVYDRFLVQLGTLIVPTAKGSRAAVSTKDLAIALSAFTTGLLTYHLLFDTPQGLQRRRTQIQSQLQRSLEALVP